MADEKGSMTEDEWEEIDGLTGRVHMLERRCKTLENQLVAVAAIALTHNPDLRDKLFEMIDLQAEIDARMVKEAGWQMLPNEAEARTQRFKQLRDTEDFIPRLLTELEKKRDVYLPLTD